MGDIVIQMISGDNLLKQKVQTVLGSNKGEWILNRDEGIEFSDILGKGNSEDIIRSEIQNGLNQVDETFVITSFEMDIDIDRKYKISFTAQNSDGKEIKSVNYYN